MLWTFRLPWQHAYHGTGLPLWTAQFAFGFYSVMLTSTILGLATMVLFRPRSWCVYCPMGTMTQMICKAKAGACPGAASGCGDLRLQFFGLRFFRLQLLRLQFFRLQLLPLRRISFMTLQTVRSHAAAPLYLSSFDKIQEIVYTIRIYIITPCI
mgnify:CR=1 FL=1